MSRSFIQRLHDSGIAGEVMWLPNGAWHVAIGSPPLAVTTVGNYEDAKSWLRRKALALYPHSEFAREEMARAV